jgi:cytochrome c-type biogenesis protein CcmF
MWSSFPLFGTTALLIVMVAASYTFAVSLAAGRNGRPRTLQAARFGAYGTVALIAASVLCLAYAFVSHDFRIRYVAQHSDRSMPTIYLVTALWGGQDGSLLWWMFLLSVYVGACVKWLGKKYVELQPYIIATLMGVILFFCVIMAFAANPFSQSVAGAVADGQGMNPLLQDFYMIIHPPSLYTGFVGCTVPFAFAIAALVTGRLDQEWIVASRKWTLFAWMFLAIGNTLGALWAYRVLGWGGYWGWDPVENAAFLPLLTASAFVHSVMIQERRGLLKVWNVCLVCLTFFLTIFGTFLTRSGAIASVHSFAQSSIGSYFVWFLGVLFIVSSTLIFYRWPELRDLPPSPRLRWAAVATGWTLIGLYGPGLYLLYNLPTFLWVRIGLMAVGAGAFVFVGMELVFRRMTRGLTLVSKRPQLESLFSREFTFLLNNWGLLGFMLFVLVATTFPMISEAFWNEKVTVGPPYYNAWVQPIGLVIFMLMGVGTLFGWKKTSEEALLRAFRIPASVFVGTILVMLVFGRSVGFPAIVWAPPIYPGALGQALRAFNAVTALLGVSLVTFNLAVLVQEFTLLFLSRRRSGANKDTPAILWYAGILPGFLYTIFTLPPPSRRRYGGYIVHLGIIFAFIGFTGRSWTVDKETSLSPGQTYQVEGYQLEYTGPRMEVDNAKRMIFADVRVTRDGKLLGDLHPAKFIYKKSPDTPTTEVSMLNSVREDLYLIVGTINPTTKVATLQIHINPLVNFIWFGCMVLIFGSIVCMWPQLELEESRSWSFARRGVGVATGITLGIFVVLWPSPALAQTEGVSSLHAGSVEIKDDNERFIFTSLRCMCGTCARDLLSTCACSAPNGAEEARAEIRAKIARGETAQQIIAAYQAKWGIEALAIPPNDGAMRTIYAVPIVAIFGGAVALAVTLKRWLNRPATTAAAEPVIASKTQPSAEKPGAADQKVDAYDARLDEELKDLDD